MFSMYKSIVYLLVTALFLQLGCSSITQIPYPVDESKSDNEIKSLNYFGGRLNLTIQITNSIEVEAYWFNMKEDKIFFLARGMEDTTALK